MQRWRNLLCRLGIHRMVFIVFEPDGEQRYLCTNCLTLKDPQELW